MKAVLNFSRFYKSHLITLKQYFQQMDIKIEATTSHSGEQTNLYEVFPNAMHYVWSSYRLHAKWNEKFNKELFDKVLASKKDIALPIVERYGPFCNGSMIAEMRLMQDFSIAHEIVTRTNPDIILFTKEVESGVEYCLYLLAKYYRIATLINKKIFFPHSMYITTNLHTPLLNNNGSLNKTVVSNKIISKNRIYQLSKESNIQINKIKNAQDSFMQTEILQQGIAICEGKLVFDLMPKNKNNTNKSSYLQKIFDYSEKSASLLDEIDWNKKTYFFPLHYQPEASSMPAANEYVNQLKIIKLISDNLTDNEQLLVKEHPSTFSIKKKTNSNFRDTEFYDWIGMIPKTHLMSVTSNQNKLVDYSDVIITLRGSVILESLLKNKPVFAFANTTFRNIPGVYHIEDFDDIIQGLESIRKHSKVSFDVIKQYMAMAESIGVHLEHSPYESNDSFEKFCELRIKTLIQGLTLINEKKQNS